MSYRAFKSSLSQKYTIASFIKPDISSCIYSFLYKVHHTLDSINPASYILSFSRPRGKTKLLWYTITKAHIVAQGSRTLLSSQSSSNISRKLLDDLSLGEGYRRASFNEAYLRVCARARAELSPNELPPWIHFFSTSLSSSSLCYCC